jgi:hypothetical protein
MQRTDGQAGSYRILPAEGGTALYCLCYGPDEREIEVTFPAGSEVFFFSTTSTQATGPPSLLCNGNIGLGLKRTMHLHPEHKLKL